MGWKAQATQEWRKDPLQDASWGDQENGSGESSQLLRSLAKDFWRLECPWRQLHASRSLNQLHRIESWKFALRIDQQLFELHHDRQRHLWCKLDALCQGSPSSESRQLGQTHFSLTWPPHGAVYRPSHRHVRLRALDSRWHAFENARKTPGSVNSSICHQNCWKSAGFRRD